MESNSTLLEQDKKERPNREERRNSTEVNGQSPLYMIIFYLVTVLVLFSMVFQFISFVDIWNNTPMEYVTYEIIENINKALPYENLIISLILYCLGTFGFEGTRAVIMSFDLKNISEKASNMPAYKRNRLIQMLITFTIITITGMIFEMICIKHSIPKADFQLSILTTGIGTFMSLLAYSDLGPKVSKQVGSFVSSLTSKPDETVKEETVTEADKCDCCKK